MSDTPNGETVNGETPKNDATPPATPPVVKAEDTTAVDELRKQLEQAKMRENQLANQLKTKEEQETAAKQKEMEEQNEFKSLYEQEKAKREAIEAERQAAERTSELSKAKATLLSEYSDEVKTLAEEVGIELTDTDESAQAAFKEKLEKINTRVVSTGSVGPNNRQERQSTIEATPEAIREAAEDPTGKAVHELLMQRPGIAMMAKPKQ